MLQQDGHPIALIFKTFEARNKGHSVYDKELLAITFVVSKWGQYVEQGPFYIKLTMRESNTC